MELRSSHGERDVTSILFLQQHFHFHNLIPFFSKPSTKNKISLHLWYAVTFRMNTRNVA